MPNDVMKYVLEGLQNAAGKTGRLPNNVIAQSELEEARDKFAALPPKPKRPRIAPATPTNWSADPHEDEWLAEHPGRDGDENIRVGLNRRAMTAEDDEWAEPMHPMQGPFGPSKRPTTTRYSRQAKGKR
jgi:hypothetical protein